MTKRLQVLFITVIWSYSVIGQVVVREPKESVLPFISRISSVNYFPENVVSNSLNTSGEKIIYFYRSMIADTALNKQGDSIACLRMVVLIQDTVQKLSYMSIDLELDTDKGFGLGIESAEAIKNKKEKLVNIVVYHLMPGPGRVRFKAYENFVLKQKSNTGGFFNDFELIRKK